VVIYYLLLIGLSYPLKGLSICSKLSQLTISVNYNLTINNISIISHFSVLTLIFIRVMMRQIK